MTPVGPSKAPALRPLPDAEAFQAALATRPLGRSAHFVLHHRAPAAGSLSTGPGPLERSPVDGHRLGCILPKKQARRAVTRNLIRRQIRAAVHGLMPRLPAGDWVVRLRQGPDRSLYPSAASEPLRRAIREDLAQLFHQALGGSRRAGR